MQQLANPSPLAASTIEALETELSKLQNIHDCAVVAREGPAGPLWVAYVVTNGPLSPSAVNGRLPASVRPPDVYVPVTRLPRDAAGQPDIHTLLELNVLDAAVAQRFERALAERNSVEHAAAFLDAPDELPDVIHISELSLAVAVPSQPASPEPGALQDEPAAPVFEPSSERVAISHGPELSRGPDAPRTLPDTLIRAATTTEGAFIHYLESSGEVTDHSFADLLKQARTVAAALAARGVEVGSKVVIQLTDPAQILPAFWGCLLRGAVPAISAVPPSYADGTNELERLCHVSQLLELPPFITSRALQSGVNTVAARLGMPDSRVFAIEDLLAVPAEFDPPDVDPQSSAFLVMTSGSTGMPKVIMLSHDNILTRSLGTNLLCRHETSDRILNWLPFDHIGSISDWHLRCVDLQCHMVYCSKEYVLGDPLNWLRVMDRFAITHSWAPNFAYALVNEALKRTSESFQLSSVKALLTAGEAVSSNTVHDFLRRLAPHGFPSTAMRPAFGMAELGSGVTYFQPTPEQPVRLETVDRRTLDGALRRVRAEDPQALAFPSLGPVIPGASMRVVDEQNRPVPEMFIGRLQIAGGPVCLGYYKNPAANSEVFVGDGWFNTGDRAFISDGELYLAGRDKETLIVNGANFHNSEIEAAAEEVKGISVSFTAACAVRPLGQSQEKLAVFVCPLVRSDHQVRAILREVQNSVAKRTGVKPDYLIPVDPTEIPKTAIGKIQRKQLVKRFETGEFEAEVVRADRLLENERTLPNWFLTPTWQPQSLPPSLGVPVRVAVVGDGAGLALALERALPEAKLFAGTQELEQSLAAGELPDAIIDVTGYGPPTNSAPADSAWSLSQTALGLFKRVRRSSEGRYGKPPLRYLVAASRSQSTPWSAVIDPERASLPAVLRAADQETTAVDCCHVDLPEGASDAVLDSCARLLLLELAAPVSDFEVAYSAARERGSSRMALRFDRVDWASRGEQPRRLEPKGLYLVTGGLGGVGTELVKVLLSQVGAAILIAGRTSFETSSGATSDHSAHPERPAKLDKLRELQSLGRVRYRALDICDKGELEKVVAEAEAEFGQPLIGAFHLAGVYRETPLLDESVEGMAAALGPKVNGALAVVDVMSRRPRGFSVFFSSLAGVFSGSGLGSYSLANRFLDALSELDRKRYQRATYSLNWSVWKGLGIGADSAPSSVLRSKGYLQVPAQPGMLSLFAILRREPGQLLIGVEPASPALQRLTTDPVRTLQSVYGAVALRRGSEPRLAMRELVDVSVADAVGKPVTGNVWWLSQPAFDERGELDRVAVHEEVRGSASVVIPPKTELERKLAAIWQEVLDLEAVGTNQSFFDLGGTSLLSVRLFSGIKREFGVSLEPALLFRAATIGAMAKVLAEEEGLDARPGAAGATSSLFFIDGDVSEASTFRALATALAPVCDFVVLEPMGRERIPTLHTRFEELLAHYEQTIRKRAAHGPYLVAGRGLGAAIALEVAARLQSAGESVPVLAWFDPVGADESSFLDGVLRIPQLLQSSSDVKSGLTLLKNAFSNTLASLGKEGLDRGRVELLRYYTDRKQEPPWFLEHIPLSTVYRYASARRRPSYFDGRIIVFRTPVSAASGDDQTWSRFASGGVDVHDIDPVFSDDVSAPCAELLVREFALLDERPVSA